MLNHWHAQDRESILHQLGTDPARGLQPGESSRRLREQGPNSLQGPGAGSAAAWATRQLASPPVLFPALAAVLCGSLGAWGAAAALAVATAANAALGSPSGRRRNPGSAALREISAISARVVRGGRTFIVPAAELVVGDLAVIAPGELVPADLRLVDARLLAVDESALTGGAAPIVKDAGAVVPASTALAGRSNMLFAGTTVTAGGGSGVVVATGMRTELGGIASLLAEADPPPPPVQEAVGGPGRLVTGMLLGAVAALALAAQVRARAAAPDLLAAVATALALPALPGVVAAVFRRGARRLRALGAEVVSPAAIDTLGSAGVVCTDATGVLTLGEITVRELCVEGELLEVGGSGFAPEGSIRLGGRLVDPGDWQSLGLALRTAVLSAGARLRRCEGEGGWEVEGDPVGGALLAFAAKGGVWREELEAGHEPVAAFPAAAGRHRSTVLVADVGTGLVAAHTRGEPGAVLAHCLHHRTPGGVRPLGPADREAILRRAEEMSSRGLRPVGLACREGVVSQDRAAVERAMVWLGLAGLADPPRPEAAAALAACRAAGVRPVIVTGEGKEAAQALARQVGFLGAASEVLTGAELDALTPEALAASVDRYGIFAGVTAAHRLRIVRAWRRRGQVVAVAGGGVSDAPALRDADIGIASGRLAPAAARLSADVVLSGKSFAGIIEAVDEGRVAAGGLRLAIALVVGGGVGAAGAVLAAGLAGLPSPLTPQAALLSGVVAGGIPALGLAIAPRERGASGPAPRGSARGLGRERWVRALAGGAAIAVAAIGAYLVASRGSGDPEGQARSAALAACGFAHLALALAVAGGASAAGLRGRRGWLALAVALALAAGLVAGAVSWAPAAAALGGTPLRGAGDWLPVLALALAPLPAASLAGVAARRWSRGA